MPVLRPILCVLAPAVIACLAGVSNAQAASFNCSKAKQPDEKAICADHGLSDLDVQMAALYGVRMQIPMLMGAKGIATTSTSAGSIPACSRQNFADS